MSDFRFLQISITCILFFVFFALLCMWINGGLIFSPP